MSLGVIEARSGLSSPEVFPGIFDDTLRQIQDLPETVPDTDVIKVGQMSGDGELVAEAQRNIKTRLLGDIAIAESIELANKPIRSIREGIVWASQGDEEGISMIDANIGTEMIEQAYKAGNVVSVRMKVDNDDIYQHGQRMSDVQRNAYQLASDDSIIRPRTEAEANNVVRMKRLYDMGLLEDNVYVRLSMCAEGVSDEKLDELKFFSSTKSISIQAAYSNNGELFDEVAMVAGVKNKDAKRHDREMIEGLAEYFGHSYSGMSAPEIIDDGMLIPKKYIKNGVVDIVQIMDDIAGGTFFGQDAPKQDYEKYKEFCEQRAARFNDDVVAVRSQLIAEKDELKTAIDASKRLAKLVEGKVVDRAFTDKSIDPIVFGKESAEHLIHARELAAAGQLNKAQDFLQAARATAKGGSCPSAVKDSFNENGSEASSAETSGESDRYGSLTFKCQKGHTNERPRGKLIDKCKSCGISVKC